MTVEIISGSISTKVWDRAGIELATPGSAVRHASVARHVTDCATQPGKQHMFWLRNKKINFMVHTFKRPAILDKINIQGLNCICISNLSVTP